MKVVWIEEARHEDKAQRHNQVCQGVKEIDNWGILSRKVIVLGLYV